MVKAQTVMTKTFVQRSLSGMAKRRMTNVVNQGKRLGQIHIEIERGGDVASHLRHLHGVGQPTSKVVGGAASEDLCLASQATESTRLDHAVAVPLKGCAVVA